MAGIICDHCPIMCGIQGGTVAVKPPKDMNEPVPGNTPDGKETNDLRPFCKANFIPEPES